MVPSTFGRSPTAETSWSRSARASRESTNVSVPWSEIATTYAVSPPAPLSALASRSAAAWESVPGAAIESSSCFPKPAEAATTRTERSTQTPMAIQGRVADQRPQRYNIRDMASPSSVARPHRRVVPRSRSSRPRHIGVEAGPASAVGRSGVSCFRPVPDTSEISTLGG